MCYKVASCGLPNRYLPFILFIGWDKDKGGHTEWSPKQTSKGMSCLVTGTESHSHLFLHWTALLHFSVHVLQGGFLWST